MFYKLKAALYRNKSLVSFYKKLFRGSSNNEPNIRKALIGKYAVNRTFIDVGCMWGVNGYFSFLAEELGAKDVIAFDIYDATEKFNQTKNEKKSNVRFMRGDINSKESIKNIGKRDVVYCTGLLYHVPDPLYTLARLREICGEVLILGTAVIPELNGIQNGAVFYPYLNSEQSRIWDTNQGGQLGITEPFDAIQGYGNWIWGFSSSCLESMVKVAGFDVLERHYGRYYSYIVSRISDKPFLAVSGDWSEPQNKESVSGFKF